MYAIQDEVIFDESTPPQTQMKVYGRSLVESAKVNSRIVCLCADLTKQTGVDAFQTALSERFFIMGMAEQNMIGVASGMAQGDIFLS